MLLLTRLSWHTGAQTLLHHDSEPAVISGKNWQPSRCSRRRKVEDGSGEGLRWQCQTWVEDCAKANLLFETNEPQPLHQVREDLNKCVQTPPTSLCRGTIDGSTSLCSLRQCVLYTSPVLVAKPSESSQAVQEYEIVMKSYKRKTLHRNITSAARSKHLYNLCKAALAQRVQHGISQYLRVIAIVWSTIFDGAHTQAQAADSIPEQGLLPSFDL